ncbi:MAG: hypothetical protein ABJC50_09460, partial [Nonlabens ulvanivorans]|uniref:hypothetical protein n=2 Tax=Nonlabens TaxID=363408 RepID=UPI0032656717
MEKTIEEQKQMVYETLLESKKPLMAKRIAYNIYRKYDGYRMSRFVVRDILWKEMKGQFEYDKNDYTYIIKKRPNIKSTDLCAETQKPEKENLYQETINILLKKEGYETVSEFKNLIKSNFLGVNTGNKKFDELIKLVVKDNKITPAEESFLKEKTHELGLPFDLINKAKKHINSNNPYLDNIIHLIFEDGIISEKELIFLKEKEKENNFSKSFVNQRFWQIGVCFYLKELMKHSQFITFIELWEVGVTFGLELFKSDTWLILNLDIHRSNNIKTIIEKGQSNIRNKLLEYLYNNYRFKENELKNFCKVLNLEYKFNEEENIEENDKKIM